MGYCDRRIVGRTYRGTNQNNFRSRFATVAANTRYPVFGVYLSLNITVELRTWKTSWHSFSFVVIVEHIAVVLVYVSPVRRRRIFINFFFFCTRIQRGKYYNDTSRHLFNAVTSPPAHRHPSDNVASLYVITCSAVQKTLLTQYNIIITSDIVTRICFKFGRSKRSVSSVHYSSVQNNK